MQIADHGLLACHDYVCLFAPLVASTTRAVSFAPPKMRLCRYHRGVVAQPVDPSFPGFEVAAEFAKPLGGPALGVGVVG